MVLSLSARRVVTVHPFKCTRWAQAAQQIFLCGSKMVSCRYECVSQRVPACACANVMLLCMAHGGVQANLPSTTVWTIAASCSACYARVGSPSADRTDRTPMAERTRRASKRGTDAPSPLAHPFLARSVRTTPSNRRSSGSDASRHSRQSHNYSMRSAYRWKSSHRHPFPLLLISFTCLPPYASRFEAFEAFVSRVRS